MITHAKSLIRASIDSSVLTLTRQKEGEDVKEFIFKFKQLFDRNIALDGGHTANKHLFNQLLIDALQPHLKVAIQRHDPIFWKSRTIDEIITLAEHFNSIVAPPIPKAKILSVMTPDGHVKLHSPPHADLSWGSEGSRQQDQLTRGETPHTPQNSNMIPLCYSCGTVGHVFQKCPQFNPTLPFRLTHRQARLKWPNRGKKKSKK